MHGFFLIMLLWPDKQRKAQEEIDRVVGNDRLPDFNDRERLPYIEAVLKECMRLHTAVPMGECVSYLNFQTRHDGIMDVQRRYSCRHRRRPSGRVLHSQGYNDNAEHLVSLYAAGPARS